jgi:hypothetical protein
MPQSRFERSGFRESFLMAIYEFRQFVAGGGMMSYGPVLIDAYRHAGTYASRILKGEKPGDLPFLLLGSIALQFRNTAIRLASSRSNNFRCGSSPLVPVSRCEWLARRAAE